MFSYERNECVDHCVENRNSVLERFAVSSTPVARCSMQELIAQGVELSEDGARWWLATVRPPWGREALLTIPDPVRLPPVPAVEIEERIVQDLRSRDGNRRVSEQRRHLPAGKALDRLKKAGEIGDFAGGAARLAADKTVRPASLPIQ